MGRGLWSRKFFFFCFFSGFPPPPINSSSGERARACGDGGICFFSCILFWNHNLDLEV